MRFRYFLAETLTNLRRNVLMTVAAISTVVIALLLLGGVQLLGMIVNNMTQSWEAKVEVSVFLEDNAQEGEIQALTASLEDMPEVVESGVSFVSKEEAFERFKEQFADSPEFWQSLPRDALPASLEVKLTDANFAPLVTSRIEGAPGVDEVRYGGEIIRRLLQVNSLLRSVTFGMSIVLMTAAAALIANTIRLGIYARREEIGIMKLVGATNWFIRIPFMLEGVFASLAGALVSGAVIVGAETLIFSKIGGVADFLGPIFTFKSSEIIGVLLLLLVVGVIVGLVGSGLALRRFLEV